MASVKTISESALPPEWQRWIAENKMQDLGDERILAILVANGFDEVCARDAVHRLDDASVNLTVGIWNTQRLKKLESVLNALHSMASLSSSYGTVCRKESVSRQQFLEEYYSANKSVILTDVMRNWSALHRWTPEYLKSRCGDVAVEVMTGRSGDPAYEVNLEAHKSTILFREFIDRVFSAEPTNDFYLTGNNHFLENVAVQCLLEDVDICTEYLNAEIPGHSFFWFGPRGTITQPHHDELNILMSQVLGRKKITLVSPDQTHLLYNNLGVYSDVDWDTPDYARYPLFKRVKKTEVLLSPGESLFIPVGWWHYVRAVDASLTISFSNFVFPNEFSYLDPEIRSQL
jgi:hypothetical protein